MIKPRVNVVVNLQVEGLHQWSECNVPEVMFLRHLHRHIFHIKCKKEVSHGDRDIEIIKLKREITKYLKDTFGRRNHPQCNFGNMSCEMIAIHLAEKFELNYCEVLEDGENGAEVNVYDYE